MTLSRISTTPTLLAVCLLQVFVQLPAQADCSLIVRLESPVEREMRRAMEDAILDPEPNEFSILTINRGPTHSRSTKFARFSIQGIAPSLPAPLPEWEEMNPSVNVPRQLR